ncbi:TetR/AcrR family transcriptional regulator [Mycobacterium sp. MMS18-G62]
MTAEPAPLRRDAVARGLADRQAAADAAVGQLLQIAQRQIRRDGTVDLSLRELLDEAGIGTRWFYRHFESKEAFLLVMLEDLFTDLAEYLRRAMDHAGAPRDRVIAWINGVLDQAEPSVAELGRPLLAHAARLNQQFPAAYRAVSHAMLAPLTAAIAAGIADDTLRSADSAADARAIFFMTLSIMQSHVLEGTTCSEQERAGIADFALRALSSNSGS